MNWFKKRKWRKSQSDLLERLPNDKYELYTVKGSLIDNTIAKRYLKYRHVIESHNDFKLDKRSLDVAFDTMESLIDQNKVAAVSQWIGMLRAMKDLTYFENELFAICDCFILLPGEPIDDFSVQHTKEKRKMFDNDPEVRVFFCQFGHELIRHLNSLPEDTNVMDYLENRQQTIIKGMYERLISPKLEPKDGRD